MSQTKQIQDASSLADGFRLVVKQGGSVAAAATAEAWAKIAANGLPRHSATVGPDCSVADFVSDLNAWVNSVNEGCHCIVRVPNNFEAVAADGSAMLTGGAAHTCWLVNKTSKDYWVVLLFNYTHAAIFQYNGTGRTFAVKALQFGTPGVYNF